MSEFSSRQLSVKTIKRQAHYLAKKSNISKGEALEVISKQSGFSCWSDFRVYLLKAGDKTRDKIYLSEFDPSSHNYDQIRGVNFSEGNPNIQIKTSCLSLFGHDFPNIKDLIFFFDSQIKDIISLSKNNLFICLLVVLDSNKTYPFKDQDNFFKFILDRYERLQYIEVFPFSTDPSFSEKLEWISQFDQKMSGLLKAIG